MAITYNIVDFRGKAAEPIMEELLFENETVRDGLVTFQDDIKAETIFTEASASATMQAYTSGAPSSAGSLDAFDVAVTPVKVQYYQEFDPNTIRFSRFKRDMAPGAWNILSGEFERVVIGGVYAKNISASLESLYWNNALAATKVSIAALTPGAPQTSIGAEEQTLAAATTAGLFDGVVTTMMYNASNAAASAGVGGRIKVVGTTITSANIKAEYDKVYAAIPAVVLAGAVSPPYIYAPRSHKQLINIYDSDPTNFRDAFDVSADRKSYFYNGVEIKFVPIPENVLIAAKKEHLHWCTDLVGDVNTMQIDKIAANREDMFLKNNLTVIPHVQNQAFNVLYVG